MTWKAGDRIVVRGADWRVVHATSFGDCEALGLAHERSPVTRTLLLPFDRPRSASQPRLQVVSRKRFAREVTSLLRTIHPYGALQFCSPSIRLLPYQLEPALAMLRHGVVRILIADEVGLGKTVEAGLLVREIALRSHLSRSLIVTPASVREQWRQELGSLFEIATVEADAAWLRRNTGELPPDVNPWSLPGVYLASMDFIKRPEALGPLEDVRWDLLVVDEAHAAAPGSDRRAAVQAIAIRARKVVLLTATPHSGKDDDFRALCAIGSAGDPSPIVLFRRTFADVGALRQATRSRVLTVRQNEAERHLHRLLDEYTSRLWAEAHSRNDSGGELVATVLRKRALSTPVSLARSIRRRLELLAEPAAQIQLLLPLEDDGRIEEDGAPDSILFGGALADAHDERQILTRIAEQAELAAPRESKVRALLRLVRRVREPAIVFTEYRDTADHLSRALVASGHRVSLLHGGLGPKERATVLATFRSDGGLLVATDAASEGLNLQHGCRLVVHFELPWTPARLHQRRGRVDRIGQTRTVHEIALVARASCEQLVLIPLLARATRAGSFEKSSVAAFAESRVAAHVLGGVPIPTEARKSQDLGSPLVRKLDLSEEAKEEASRQAVLRRLGARRSKAGERRVLGSLPIARCRRGWPLVRHDLTLLLVVSVRDPRGTCVDDHAVLLGLELGGCRWHRRHGLLRRQVERQLGDIRITLEPVVRRLTEARLEAVAWARRHAIRAGAARESAMRSHLRSTARQLVQIGLFDRRAMRASATKQRTREMALDDLIAHTDSVEDLERGLTGTCELRAVLVGSTA